MCTIAQHLLNCFRFHHTLVGIEIWNLLPAAPSVSIQDGVKIHKSAEPNASFANIQEPINNNNNIHRHYFIVIIHTLAVPWHWLNLPSEYDVSLCPKQAWQFVHDNRPLTVTASVHVLVYWALDAYIYCPTVLAAST